MTLDEAKKEVDHTLAALFYEKMKNVKHGDAQAHEVYKHSINETSQLLHHMRDRLEILFGQDSEKLAQFLYASGVGPHTEN